MPVEPITVLSEDESWNLLAGVTLGRLITTLHGQIEIFPVNFVVQHRTVLFRSAEGTNLLSAAMNDEVVFARHHRHWLCVRVGRDDPQSQADFFLDRIR